MSKEAPKEAKEGEKEKIRKGVSYVFGESRSGGHCLGVTGLALDSERGILYSGGRDGVVCSWDLDLDKSAAVSPTRLRTWKQTHLRWINDMVLAANNTAVVTASSDQLVKIWRPDSASGDEPAVLGHHKDFVKCVATPGRHASWVASGALAGIVSVWDLQGGGRVLDLDVCDANKRDKGSVYALCATNSVIASGGPETTVRLWDTRSGKPVVAFGGHGDMVRSLLISDAGDTVVSASSDRTVKVWSVTAGRCLHTLSMHNESVWSLSSDAPSLDVFYSGDRSGLVVKTDLRGCVDDLDNGLSVAVAQEDDGVLKTLAGRGFIWSTTGNAEIHRWADIDTAPVASEGLAPEPVRRPHSSSVSTVTGAAGAATGLRPMRAVPPHISPKAVLRLSKMPARPAADVPGGLGGLGGLGATTTVPTTVPTTPGVPGPHSRKGSVVTTVDAAPVVTEPVYKAPAETIAGKRGLMACKMLNDRRRVLTRDTANNIALWDLVACRMVKNYGARELEEVEDELNTGPAMTSWCNVDVRCGLLTVEISHSWYDVEVYVDELLGPGREVAGSEVYDARALAALREELRIMPAMWVMRYLFARLVDEEVRRDAAFRAKLNAASVASGAVAKSDVTAKLRLPSTPGIMVATPLPLTTPGTERVSSDYFNVKASTEEREAREKEKEAKEKEKEAKEKEKEKEQKEAKEKEKEKEKGKKSWKGMIGKLGLSASAPVDKKDAVAEEAPEAEADVPVVADKTYDDTFSGTLQRLHDEYEEESAAAPGTVVQTRLEPLGPSDAPVVAVSDDVAVIIWEELPGGMVHLYRGTVGSTGADADVIERLGPAWLGDAVLLSAIPQSAKEAARINFLLRPYDDALPEVAPAGNPDTATANATATTTANAGRLSASGMLRIRKILGFVAEKLEGAEAVERSTVPPESYLELYCNEQRLEPTATLRSVQLHVWRGTSDVVLHYKAVPGVAVPGVAGVAVPGVDVADVDVAC